MPQHGLPLKAFLDKHHSQERDCSPGWPYVWTEVWSSLPVSLLLSVPRLSSHQLYPSHPCQAHPSCSPGPPPVAPGLHSGAFPCVTVCLEISFIFPSISLTFFGEDHTHRELPASPPPPAQSTALWPPLFLPPVAQQPLPGSQRALF